MIAEQNEFDGFLGGLIERYTPEGDSFDVLTEKGDAFRFKFIASSRERQELRRKANDFADWVASGKVDEKWRPFATQDKETLVYVFHMAELNTQVLVVPLDGGDPETHPKLSQFDFLVVASKAPDLFDAIKKALDMKLAVAVITKDVQGVDDAIKKSSQTSFGDTSSEPPATSGESTLAS